MSDLFGGGTASSKAKLHCLDNSGWSVSAQFNPTSFKYTRATEWTLEQSIGFSHAWQRMAFKTGKIDELDVTLLFDESEDRSDTTAADFIPNMAALAPPSMQGALPASMQPTPTTDDALASVAKLHKLTMPVNFGSAAKPEIRPPAVAFVWGTFEFQGFITSLSNEVLLFDETGGARRVKSTLKLQGHAFKRATSVDELMDAKYTAAETAANAGIDTSSADNRSDILAKLLE